MFVVMSQSASEAEILGVKSRILAEGLTAAVVAELSGSAARIPRP